MKSVDGNDPTDDGQRIILFIVVVNDILRRVVRKLIAKSAHLSVCGEANSVEQAVEKIGNCLVKPEIVLVDLFSPEKDAAIMFHLKERYAGIRVLAISAYEGAEVALRAFAAGANGYLLKEELTNLDEVVAEVIKGRGFISQKVKDQLSKHE